MIDVVMLAYNFNEDLAQLTQSTMYSLKQSSIEKLIVVDNNSSVGGGTMREQADIYIRNNVNAGYPKAINQGFALSDTPFVAFANNDIRVSKDWVEVAEEIFKNPKVGTVHFKMIPYEEPIVPGEDIWIGGKERWCHGSFYVIRREAFQGYDVNYGAGGFDDYSHFKRMREKGWIQAYTNKCPWQHMDSVTYRTMEPSEERAKRDAKNREYYKSVFGEYPEIQFEKEFPDQVALPYWPFP